MAAGCLLEGYRQLLQLATPIPSRHQSIPVYAVCMASSLYGIIDLDTHRNLKPHANMSFFPHS